MDFEQQAQDMRKKILNATGQQMEIRIESKRSPRSLHVKYHHSGGTLPDGAPLTGLFNITWRHFSQNDLMVDKVSDFIFETTNRLIKEIRGVIAMWREMVDNRKSVVSTLKDLEITLYPSHGYGNYGLRWTGYAKEGIRARQRCTWMFFPSMSDRETLHDVIREIEAEEERREQAAGDPFSMDRPLTAMLAANDIDMNTFINDAKMVSAAAEYEGQKDAKMTVAGVTIAIKIKDRHIMADIPLGDDVRWAKGCIVVKNMALPEVIATSALGRPMGDVVGHPWLDGLTVGAVVQNNGKKGNSLVITPKVAA